MAPVVYVLCFLTSLSCAWMLLRSFKRNGVKLLLWSGLCFVGLAINNAALFADRVIWPDVDLTLMRSLPVIFGLTLLIYGMAQELK